MEAAVAGLDSKSTSFDVALVSLHMFGGLLLIRNVIEYNNHQINQTNYKSPRINSTTVNVVIYVKL